VLVLTPAAARPRLTAYRRSERPSHDARIAGTFLDLLAMIDGSLDGDSASPDQVRPSFFGIML